MPRSRADLFMRTRLDVGGHPFVVSCYLDLNPSDGEAGPGEKATALVGFDVSRNPSAALRLRLNTDPPVDLDVTTS